MRFAGSDSAMQSLFGNMSKNTPGVLEDLGTKTRSSTRNAVTEGQFNIDKAKIDAEAIKEGAQIKADAIRSQNQSNMMGDIFGAVGSIAGGLGSMGGGGGEGFGSFGSGAFGSGGYGDIGDKYSGAFTSGQKSPFSFAQGMNFKM